MKRRIYLRIGKITVFLILGALLFNEESGNRILTWQEGFIPKMSALFFLIFFLDVYWKEIQGLFKKLRRLQRVGTTIDGIPSRQLLHILISTNGLLYKNFAQNISSDKKQYSKICNNLERVGILYKGNKNARILTNTYSQEQIFKLLSSTSDSDSLPTPLVRVGESSYEFIKHSF